MRNEDGVYKEMEIFLYRTFGKEIYSTAKYSIRSTNALEKISAGSGSVLGMRIRAKMSRKK
jgi:hypothetical protein